MYLSITNVSKSYGVHQVLNQVSLVLNAGQRIGLVGANGVGKSTLLKIIMHEVEADQESVFLTPGTQIGYLPQTLADIDGKTIADLIAEAMQHLRALETRLRELEQHMENGEPDHLDAIMQEYGELTEAFERYGGYEIDYRVDAVLNGLGIGHLPRHRQLTTLSGGEQARISLAMLLLEAPDVLLLDEPTNHLDFASLSWLEAYLAQYRGAILIVSHDRHFLNRTVTTIVEIEEHSRTAKHYAGDYDAYLQAKTAERQRWQADYERQQEEIKTLRHEIKVNARQVAHNRGPTDSDKFLKSFKQGRVGQAISRRVGASEERLRRIESDPIPRPPANLRFAPDFDPLALKGHVPLSASGITKAYQGRTILNDVSFTLGAQSRIALVGPNGAGKSTLLKILAGIESPDGGAITINPQVRTGYLDQAQESLTPDASLLEAYRAGLDDTEQQAITGLLASGLFRYEEIGRPVRQLSSGQQRKLQIARLMAERANLLLLDEPTNYISFDVLESLEDALRHFPGPILAATHDRRFLEQFGGEIWELRAGHLIQHLAGFAGYTLAIPFPASV